MGQFFAATCNLHFFSFLWSLRWGCIYLFCNWTGLNLFYGPGLGTKMRRFLSTKKDFSSWNRLFWLIWTNGRMETNYYFERIRKVRNVLCFKFRLCRFFYEEKKPDRKRRKANIKMPNTWQGSNPRPFDYGTHALPLCYNFEVLELLLFVFWQFVTLLNISKMITLHWTLVVMSQPNNHFTFLKTVI